MPNTYTYLLPDIDVEPFREHAVKALERLDKEELTDKNVYQWVGYLAGMVSFALSAMTRAIPSKQEEFWTAQREQNKTIKQG